MKKLISVLISAAVFCISLTAYASCEVAALMYHNVTADESRLDAWCVSAAELEGDINYFTERGYITLTASELVNESAANLDGKKILLLTFDDGYEEWYSAVYPILRRTGAKATMFIVGSYVNRYGYLSENQIYELANSSLIEIGSHTRYLHSMPLEAIQTIYSSENISDAMEDIRSNNEYLEKITGKRVTALAWPYGYYNDYIDGRVKSELGCLITFGTELGAHIYGEGFQTVFCRINREGGKTSEEIYNMAEQELRAARQTNK